MSITQWAAEVLLDHIRGVQVPTLPNWPNVYTGLASAAPTGTGEAGATTTNELPNANGYARVLTVLDDPSVAPTVPRGTQNSAAVTFPTAVTADWNGGANIQYWLLFDAQTLGTGNLIAAAALITPRAVLLGETATIPIGAIRITIG